MKTLTLAGTLAGALAGLLLCTSALADPLTIPVPGAGWGIQLNAPKLSPFPDGQAGIYSGHADRLQLSFFAEPPHCMGGDSNENLYNCFATQLQKSPIVLWDSERANTAANGVHVMYMSQMAVAGQKFSAFNIDVLFAHKGKWADLHASIISPQEADVSKLMALADSVVVADMPVKAEVPAGSGAAKVQ